MVDCPDCGKPMKKENQRGKYYCESSTCSVIFVRHADDPTLMEVFRDASKTIST